MSIGATTSASVQETQRGIQASPSSGDEKLDSNELAMAGVTDEYQNDYMLNGRGNKDGYIQEGELVTAQQENIITVDESTSEIALTENGQHHSNAWNVMQRFDLSGGEQVETASSTGSTQMESASGASSGAFNASNNSKEEVVSRSAASSSGSGQLDSDELANAGIDDPNHNTFLVDGYGDGDGLVSEQELIAAQAEDIITVTDDMTLEMTENGEHKSNAWNVIQAFDGSTADVSVAEGEAVVSENPLLDGALDQGELTNAGVTDPVENSYLRETFGEEGVEGGIVEGGSLTEQGIFDAQAAGIITVADNLQISLTPEGTANAYAWNAIQIHEGTGANISPYNNDSKIGKLELMNAGITNLNDSRFLRHGIGDGDGFLDQKELVRAQLDGLITIDSEGNIQLSALGRAHSQAWNAIEQYEGTGIDRAPYNEDAKIGKIELSTAGITDLNESRFLRHGIGDGDGFLSKGEIAIALLAQLLTIDSNGRFELTDEGRERAEEWNNNNNSGIKNNLIDMDDLMLQQGVWMTV